MRVILLAVALLVTACSRSSGAGVVDSPTIAPSESPAPPAAPSGIRLDELTTLAWRLVELDGVAVADDPLVALDLGQSMNRFLAGLIDCWGYSAMLDQGETGMPLEATAAGERVMVYPRDCPDPDEQPALGADVVDALSAAASYSADDERLEFADAAGVTRLVYKPLQVVPLPEVLISRTWELRSLRGDEPLQDVAVTLQIDAHGVSGNDGCNWYGVGAIVSGDGMLRLPWPGFTQTAMGCADDVMAQAEAYTDALLRTDSFRLVGGRLETLDREGAVLLVFS